jgi:hypothetical protein
MTKIENLLRSGHTLFTIDDIALYWKQGNRDQVIESARAYANRGKLWRITQGIYSLTSKYDPAQLAAKLNSPSYITGWYVLARSGVVFQYYGEGVTSFALRGRRFLIDNREYLYHQVKKEVFFNDLGIIKNKDYWIASPERAVGDMLYLNRELSFDNLAGLDFNLLEKIARIYSQKTLALRLEKLLERA